MAQKTVLSLYTGDDAEKEAPVLGPGLQRAYDIWHGLLKTRRVTLVRASAAWYKAGYFSKYWQHNTDGSWSLVRKKIRPTVVYDKTRSYDRKTNKLLQHVFIARHEMLRHMEVVNNPFFTDLLDNKLYQAVIFQKGMPDSRFWPPKSVLKNPKNKTVVLKKLHGSGGSFVQITNKSLIRVDDSSVQQEFIEGTKNGDLRDIRITFVGETPIYAYSRVAKPGSLYTNVHLGAHMEWINLRDVKPLLTFSKQLAAPLRIFPKRFYCLDYIVSAKNNEPYLIEANKMPGTANFPDAVLERFFGELTQHIFEV